MLRKRWLNPLPINTKDTKGVSFVINMQTSQSRKLFSRAAQILPGGVDSPVRAFKAVGGSPLFIRSASGCRLQDIDGNTFIDYVMSWGPLIHGHAPKGLVKALAAAAKNGTSFGAPSPLEVALGERVRALMPSLERVRFVSSGTEATMSAVRVARAATGRDRLIKFEGCYHGHADAFLVKAGSGALTLGTPTSPGVTAACTAEGAVLIFDEVISGFRAAAGGAQAVTGVTPDLTCLGKIIGGGLPVGAYGGRADLMELVSPAGPVYQAGTLSGNPLAMTAGLWCLERLKPRLYRDLAALGRRLADGLAHAARDAGVALH